MYSQTNRPYLIEKLLLLNSDEQYILSHALESQRDERHHDFMIERERLYMSDQLIEVRKHPRFTMFKRDTNDYMELNFVLSGHLTIEVNGAYHTLNEGELIVLNQHTPHVITRCGENDLIINISIDPIFFDTLSLELHKEDGECPMVCHLMKKMFNHSSESGFFCFDIANAHGLQSILIQLTHEIVEPSFISEVRTRFLTALLFMDLMKHLNYARASYDDISDYKVTVNVIHYIERDFAVAKLGTIAKQLETSAYQINWILKKTTDKSFKCLLEEKRLKETERLLRQTNLLIDEIAEKVGYDDLSFFQRLFKERYNITPLVYRDLTQKS